MALGNKTAFSFFTSGFLSFEPLRSPRRQELDREATVSFFELKNESGTRIRAFANLTSKVTGKLLIRIEHPREGDLAFIMNYDEAVKLQRWLNDHLEQSLEPIRKIYTVTELAKEVGQRMKTVNDIIRMNRIQPIKTINRAKLYSYAEVKMVRELLKG